MSSLIPYRRQDTFVYPCIFLQDTQTCQLALLGDRDYVFRGSGVVQMYFALYIILYLLLHLNVFLICIFLMDILFDLSLNNILKL